MTSLSALPLPFPRLPDSGGLCAYLQPKVAVASARVYGFEVLARWRAEKGAMLLPGEFLPAIRQAGLLDGMLLELMEQAIAALLASGAADLRLSFNLEAEQFARPGLAALLAQKLEELGIEPQRITFELTETSPLQGLGVSLENALRLRELGCGLAIDDFGCGHSTLQRLVEMPFTELKLDRHLVTSLLSGDPRRLIVLRHALALGRELGLKVIAEGVEDPGQLRQLQQMDCDAAQGYLFGKPMPASRLDAFLRADAQRRNASTAATRTPVRPAQ
ncbi:EAL domain-containing protein [Pseudomonas sp. CAN2814]|uniref:EAL domain-containing protein n=1 Tax=Pseudomonas sp. CAN1 TaxID=3046726 RepID=UPI00264983A3|nr:EAL domain-containing protein [Pseudomonas sp. CAN1]MDN6858658.1 EAL domain-containing protein [Pseudomonas sp. CAN1]